MNSASANILVVDDEPDICANVRDILSELGYRVDTAHDGAAALQLATQKPYDVALLDLKMPGMDGLELCGRLKNLHAEMVALIITACATGETHQSAQDVGAWKVVAKPFDISALLATLQEITRPSPN